MRPTMPPESPADRNCGKLGDRSGEISGPTSVYLLGRRVLEFHFCATCGMTTHWWPVDAEAVPWMGLNARVLGRDVFQPIKLIKGSGD